jgi:hypothetical protein
MAVQTAGMDDTDPIAIPPPRLDEFATGTVIVVFDSEPAARQAIEAIDGLSDRDPYVLSAEEVVAQDRARQADAGPVQRLWRFLGGFVSDQKALQQRYVDHARGGACVLVAAAADEERAQALWEALRGHGAHDGTHVAGMTLRELV